MFGFLNFRKSLGLSTQYANTLLAPAAVNGPIPNAVFGDGYVIGFLQIPTLHATNEGYGKVVDGVKAMPVFGALLDQLVPGFGQQILNSLSEINSPNHPAHQNYIVGRNEGNQYIVALLDNDEQKAVDGIISFTAFIRNNYML